MSTAAAIGHRDLEAVLAALAGQIASLIPAMMFGYMIVIWPLAFGDASYSAVELQMGWMAPLPVDAATPSPLKMIAYPVLFILATICALFTAAYRRLPLTHPGTLAAGALVLLAILSTAWSAFATLSFARGVLLALIAATVLFSVYAAGSFRLMMRGLFVVLVLSTALNLWAVATQPVGLLGHNGIHPQKNVFGWVSGLTLFFGLYHLTFGGLAQRAAACVMIAAAPLFLVMSLSKTSLGLALLSPLAGLALVYAATRMRLSPALLVIVAAGLAAFVFFIGQGANLWTFLEVNEALLGDATLTGRTDIWEFAATLIGEKPLLGYGYEAVWGTGYEGVAYKNALGFTRIAPTGHNGYIDMLVHLGLVGFVLMGVFLCAALSTAGRLTRIDPRLGWLSLTVAIFVLLHNNLESDIFISSNPLSTLLLLLFFIGLRLTGNARR